MGSWILAATSSSDRFFLQSGEFIIATSVHRSGVNWDEQKNEQIRHVHLTRR
jgi:carbamate kinase